MDAIFKMIAEAQAAAAKEVELRAKELEALRSFYGKNPQSKQQKDTVELEKVREVLQQVGGFSEQKPTFRGRRVGAAGH